MYLCTQIRVVLVMTISIFSSISNGDEFLYDTFPEGFMFGTATSAYQIEGGWNAGSKGESIWDRFCHVGGKVANNDTGDVSCDSYNKYADDVQLAKNMKVKLFRFSISWARILPSGTDHNSDPVGVQYYHNLIDELIANDLEPVVTLYHWDLPQALQDIGGWENDSMVDIFADYARFCFNEYGDKVKNWLTFNEPFVFLWVGMGVGVHAPGIGDRPGTLPYLGAHVVLQAHAEAWHIYDDEFRSSQKGRCAITLDSDWKEKNSSSVADVAAAERAMAFKLGWFANPIFGSGDYPTLMKETVSAKSASQNLTSSRLPEFTQEQVTRIKGTADYFGLNHYTTQYIAHDVKDPSCVSYECDQDIVEIRDESWPTTGSGWLRVVPWGIRRLLAHIKQNYGNPEIIVTENGVSDRSGTLEDTQRVNFYRDYINNVLQAIKHDGVNVTGYCAWSLMDNFEWSSGYDEKFGLHYVDFSDPARPRTPKQSAREYTTIITNHGFPQPTTTPQPSSSPHSHGATSHMLSAAAALFCLIWTTQIM